MTFTEYHGHLLTRRDAADAAAVLHGLPSEAGGRADLVRVESRFPGESCIRRSSSTRPAGRSPASVEELRPALGDLEIAASAPSRFRRWVGEHRSTGFGWVARWVRRFE